MIVISKRGPFKKAEIFFDDEAALKAARSGEFDQVTIMSYNNLPLGDFKVKPKRTAIIDTSGPAESIVRTFNDTAQKHISRTMRYEGFKFGMSAYPFPDGVYQLYAEFERGRGRVAFAPSAFRECLAFFGYDGDSLSSAAFVYPTTPIVRARSFFSARRAVTDHESYKRVGYASKRVIYEVCRWAYENGRSGFDLGPVNETDEIKQGISNFKLSFNPRLVPEYTYARSSLVYRLAEIVMGSWRDVNSLILNLRKRSR